MMNISFPDGNVRQYEAGSSALDIAKSISNSLAKKVIAAKVNGSVWDLNRAIPTDSTLQLLTYDEPEGKETFWHSSAHLMAEALQQLYPEVKFTIGPPIENGFYYDVDLGSHSLSTDDFPAIEKKMLELAKQNNPFVRREVSKAEAAAVYADNRYKTELIDNLQDGDITFYTQGSFTDLCRGPHIPHTGYIKAVKLRNVSAAYWRGDEKNPRLTRIYGITFGSQTELDEYNKFLEEAERRNHKRLGTALGLFAFSDRVGQGLPLWLPKGTVLRDVLQDFLKKEQIKSGYKMVVTPHIGKKDLYVTSGHFAKYGKDSFQPIYTPKEDELYFLKPMNCPHHCEIYQQFPFSYRDLPLRLAEFGTVYRYEQSGELNGLLRVRGFTQDDAHIFCTPDQVKDEFKNVIDLVLLAFGKMGFADFTAQVSLRHQTERAKYIGSEENWEKAEKAIIEAANEKGLPITIEYDEAAFYGPKLDFMVSDAIGRSWQLGTIQVDYNLPERFGLEYMGSDNVKHRPVMIHRAPFGSIERFIAMIIENTAGNFPLWLAPEQVVVLPISDKFNDYADSIVQQLKNKDIRVHADYRSEKIGRKIRDAEVGKIPYMLIVGEKEAENQTVSARRHGQGDKGSISLADFLQLFATETV